MRRRRFLVQPFSAFICTLRRQLRQTKNGTSSPSRIQPSVCEVPPAQAAEGAASAMSATISQVSLMGGPGGGPVRSRQVVVEAIPGAGAAGEQAVSVADALAGRDPRLLAIVGPCSVHDPKALLEFAGRFAAHAATLLDGKLAWATRSITGSAYRQTPVFADEIEYMVVNPTWAVPHSIASEELLPKIQQDPAFLSRGGYDVFDPAGARVDTAQIDWTSLHRNNFPFTLVQRPGPANAMGRVKFMFPNPHAVYLHDTPSRYLFDRADRTFSSGCIRIENPFELAEILLGPDGWDQERFSDVLDTKKERTVFLSQPVPVLLLYWTAQASPDGTVSFFPDVYQRDAAIDRALDEPFTLKLPVAR